MPGHHSGRKHICFAMATFLLACAAAAPPDARAQSKPKKAAPPANLIYLNFNGCPQGSQRTQYRFTDIFGSIFKRQSYVVASEIGLQVCQLASSGNRDRYIGEIFRSNSSSCPAGSSTAAGQSMSVNGNEALFALLGINWGGNGVRDFALPDLSLKRGERGGVFCIALQGDYP